MIRIRFEFTNADAMTTDSIFRVLLLPRYDRLFLGASPCQRRCHETRRETTTKQPYCFVHASYTMCSIQHTITHETRNPHPQHQRHVYSRYRYVVVLKPDHPPQGDYTVCALYWRHPPHLSQTIMARTRHENCACDSDARCERSRSTNLLPATSYPLLVYPLHACKLGCLTQMSTEPAAYCWCDRG